MRQKILTYDGRSLSRVAVEAPGRLRWSCWNPRDGSELLVGDRGSLLRSDGGRGFAPLRSGVAGNLRCAQYSPRGDAAYACGNGGLILALSDDTVRPLMEDPRENLRRVAWHPSGDAALFVGNNGTAYLRSSRGFEVVHGAATHLRSIAWHPTDGYALIAGNCFQDSVGGLAPSPNLFRFERGSLTDVSTLAESRADLVAASWRPGGSSSSSSSSSCLLAGYDQTWHTPALLTYDGESLREVAWEPENIFPTACAWHPSGEYALIGTSAMTETEGATGLFRFDGRSIARVEDLGGLGVSCISWSPGGVARVLASRSTRAFSV